MSAIYTSPMHMLGGFTRDMNVVPRWGILRLTRQQNVAEHSYFVTLYTVAICDLLNLGEATRDLAVRHALTHDLPETMSGDIPAPWKKLAGGDGETPALSGILSQRFGADAHVVGIVPAVVAVADLYEAAMFLAGEEAVGNQSVKEVLHHLCDRLHKACMDLDDHLDRLAEKGIYSRAEVEGESHGHRLHSTLAVNILVEQTRKTQSFWPT